MSAKGTTWGPRVPAQPLIDWLALEPRRLPENEMHILLAARKKGHINLYLADRILCMLGRPDVFISLYGEDRVAA